MKKFYLSLIFIFYQFLALGNSASYRNCILLPINPLTEAEIKIQNGITKYLQSTDWCISKSTSDLFEIFKNYNDKFDLFINNKVLRSKIVEKTNALTIIYIRNNNKKYIVEIWDKEGLIYSEKLLEELNQNEIISILEKYKKTIPYDSEVSSFSNDGIIIDIGKNFGLSSNDQLSIYKQGKRIFHPKTSEFIQFEKNIICSAYSKFSTYKSSYLKPDDNCKDQIKVGDWVVISSLSKNNFKDTEPKKQNFLDVSIGFGLGYLSDKIIGVNEDSLGGPNFSFVLDTDLLLTRSIVTNFSIAGSYAIISGDSVSVQNTFGNNWSLYFLYRIWLKNFSNNSHLDIGAGYDSNYFGFDSNAEYLLSGHKYYGLSLKGSLAIHAFGFDFFGKLKFFPSAGFNQDLQYISNVTTTNGYEIQLGGFFDLFNYQNLFALVKISKYKNSTSNNTENSIQDLGVVFGYKFRI